MILTATATFNGSQDSVGVTWSTPFVATPIVTAGVVVNDGQGGIVVDIASLTTTGCTVEVSARFSGPVELVAVG